MTSETRTSRGPAYRIVTPRLVLRCWEPADAPALVEAIAESLEHLRAWMPWVKDEPMSLDAKIEQLRGFRGKFDRDEDYVYAIFDREEARVLGGTGFHPRVGDGVLEIGYWIHAAFEGRGLVTEAVAALARTAFATHGGVHRLEIRCDPRNARSAAVPARLGFAHEGTFRRHARLPDGTFRDTMIWALHADDFASTPAASVEVEAFDAAGRRIL